MALATATVTADLADMLGTDFDTRRTKVWITTNVADETVIDTVGNKIRLGSGTVTLNDDGTASMTVWVPGTGANPTSWQTSIHVDYPDPGTRTRKVRDFGPFTITAGADLADLVQEQEVPPTYLSEVTALLDGYVAEAEAALAAMVAISGLTGEDAAVGALVAGTGGAGPLTRAALSASTERRVGGIGFAASLGVVPEFYDDFLGDNVTTINGKAAKTKQTWTYSGLTTNLPVNNNALRWNPPHNHADIAFARLSDIMGTGAMQFRWLPTPGGGTRGDNVVLGTCAQSFGTVGQGGSLQAAVWRDKTAAGVAYNGYLFAFNPDVDPATLNAIVDDTTGLPCLWQARAGFVWDETGNTDYRITMFILPDTVTGALRTCLVVWPDGQITIATSDEVLRAGARAAFQLRRANDTDGYAICTGAAAAPQIPTPGAKVAAIPLPAKLSAYFPGDDTSYAYVVGPPLTGTVHRHVAYLRPDVLDAAGCLASQYETGKHGWYLSKNATAGGRWRYTYNTATAEYDAITTVDTPFGDRVGYWLKVEHDTSNGHVTFWTSADSPDTAEGSVTWAALGSVIDASAGGTIPGAVGAIVNISKARLRVSGTFTSSPNGYPGEVSFYRLYDDGVLVRDFDLYTKAFTGYDTNGRLWALVGAFSERFPITSVAGMPSGAVVGTTDTQTLSNKRVTKRTATITNSATPAINTDTCDRAKLSGLSTNITSMTTNLTGTPNASDTLWVTITDNGTPRTIAWGSAFEASTVSLPGSTVASTPLDVFFRWSTDTSKWRCMGVA